VVLEVATRGGDEDVASFMIHDTDNNQALVRSERHPGANRQSTGSNVTMQEQLRQLQQQIEGVLVKAQQTDRQTQHTQQEMQDQIDKILQTLHQMGRQHIEEAQRMTQLSGLYTKQFEDVGRKIHQLNQEIEDSRQQTQDTRVQAQHQKDNILHKIQEMDQLVGSTRQQCELLQQQIREMGSVSYQQGHSLLEQSRQKIPHPFDQLINAQCRVRAVLAEPHHKSPIPRLFIILPAPTAAIDGQEMSRQLQFKLYFLCECGSHTMAKDSDQPHEVHLAHHPGYDLTKQDEFINEYGSYLLTMMYMIKYGAKTRGLVVPPLLSLNHAIGECENIGQLVDETITHLKEASRSAGGNTIVPQGLNASELNALKSHLKIKDYENFSGGLSPLKTQKAHHPWICKDHLREYYESTLQELRYNINTNGGVWHGKEVNIKVTSEATIKVFHNDLGKLFRIQNVENWRSITEIDLEQDSHPLTSNPTTDNVGSLNDLQSLSLDFGRFTMVIKDIFRGVLKDVAISIGDLSALTLDDMEFIQQCRPTTLALVEAPHEGGDDRLVSILQRSLSITNLRIECDMKRLMAIIDLVRSTREKLLQGESRPALHIFELIHPEIKVKVAFEEGSPVDNIKTSIKFENCQPQVIDPAVYTFIRRYGWSITNLVVPETFSDRLAKILDESVQAKGSKLAHLDITPTCLTTPGLDAMSRVINRSQGLTYLRLSLEDLGENNQREKALLLLGRHKDRLTSLRLVGWYVSSWLTPLSRTFPDRDGFPMLAEFFLECGKGLIGDTGQWITSMVSARPQPLTPVKVFGMKATELWYKGFESLINAIDLSTLEELHIKNDDFSPEQLKLLVDRVADYGAPSMPLCLLDINGEKLDNSVNTHELFVSLREKVPKIKITGIKA